MTHVGPSPRRRALLLVAYAATTFASFPHPLGGRVVDIGASIAWFGPALLILGLEGLSLRRALGLGFLAALAAHSAILHWIYVVTVQYGQAPVLVGVLAPIGLASYIATFTALFSGGWAWFAARGAASPLAAALVWTALDHLRTHALTGFPWALLGYAQHENPLLMGLASVTGVYGLSFATLLGAAALAELARAVRERRRPARSAWAALGGVLVLHGVGAWVAPPESAPGSDLVRVAALQGNIEQGVKWSPEWGDRTLSIYEELSRRAAAEGARVILWPETAVPGAIELDPRLRGRLSALARETEATLIVGGVGVERDPRARSGTRFLDSAFLVSPEGDFRERYDKSHLVPFGEFVPLRAVFGRLFGAVARGMADTDVAAGAGPRSLDVAVGADALSVGLGVPICYELLFPDLVRRFVRDGGGALFAITNDAWYGRTGAPYQFLAITALRSAETGVWVLRAANTGVSAVINGRGRVLEETEIFERRWIVADVAVADPEAPKTFYVKYGDVFVWICWIGWLALALRVGWRWRATADE